MRLILREKRIEEREVAGSSLKNQAHVSSEVTFDAVMRFESHHIIQSFNRKHAKPAGFYTSSAIQVGKMLRSDWYGFMNSEKFGSAACILLLKVNPSAKIAEVDNKEDYIELLEKYGPNPMLNPIAPEKAADPEAVKKIMDLYGDRFKNQNLNFDAIAKDFDGFRITSDGYWSVKHLSYGWDVEQTVWFNTKVLSLIPVRSETEITADKADYEEYYDQMYNYASLFEPDYPAQG